MTLNPMTACPDTPVGSIARPLPAHCINDVPVGDKQQRLLGMTSRMGRLQHLSEFKKILQREA